MDFTICHNPQTPLQFAWNWLGSNEVGKEWSRPIKDNLIFFSWVHCPNLKTMVTWHCSTEKHIKTLRCYSVCWEESGFKVAALNSPRVHSPILARWRCNSILVGLRCRCMQLHLNLKSVKEAHVYSAFEKLSRACTETTKTMWAVQSRKRCLSHSIPRAWGNRMSMSSHGTADRKQPRLPKAPLAALGQPAGIPAGSKVCGQFCFQFLRSEHVSILGVVKMIVWKTPST